MNLSESYKRRLSELANILVEHKIYKLYRKSSNSPSPGHGEYEVVSDLTLDGLFQKFLDYVRSFGNKDYNSWAEAQKEEFNRDKETYFTTGRGSLFYKIRHESI